MPYQTLAAVLAVLALAGCSRQPSRTVHRWFGMDTDFSATLYGKGSAGHAPKDSVFARLEEESARLEAIFSDYLPGSSLNLLRGRSGDTLKAHPAITEVFRAAAEMAAASRGAFDITLHDLKGAWGLSTGDTNRIPADSALTAAMRGNPAYGSPAEGDPSSRPPFRLLPDHRLVLLRDSAVFDLGGIAKGYAVDRFHAILDSLGYPDHIVTAGGDLRAGGSKGGEKWTLGIRHPRRPDELAGTLSLAEPSAVSTSGDYERFFIRDGIRYHHIFDPRTGKPARPYSSVTVLGRDGLTADRLTKPLFILGPEKSRDLLKRFGARAVWMRELAAQGTGAQGAGAQGAGAQSAGTEPLCYVASEGLEGILDLKDMPACPGTGD